MSSINDLVTNLPITPVGTAIGTSNAGVMSVQVTDASGNSIAPGGSYVGSATSSQIKIVVTGTPVQLPSIICKNGVTGSVVNCTNLCLLGTSAEVTPNVTDGTGQGQVLQAGQGFAYAVSNTNLLYFNGTAGDIISFQAN